MKKILLIMLFSFTSITISQNDYEINTYLMNSTFRIEGSGKIGTIFLLGAPIGNNQDSVYLVLITANHVLEDIKTDSCKIHLRIEKNNNYEKSIINFRIRNNGKPLWVKHPEVDVAAISFDVPESDRPKGVIITPLTTEFLATDTVIKDYEIHPGDELFCLGFPLNAEANSAGFPILRSGKISSYPIIPAKDIKQFLFDFPVFKGNSGGPVYCSYKNRVCNGSVLMGTTINYIIGLVSQETILNETIRSLAEISIKQHNLGLAVVIPAVFIKETIELLEK